MALSPTEPTFTRTVRSVMKLSPSVEAVTVTEVAESPSSTLAGLADSVISLLSSSVSAMLVPFTVRSEVPDKEIVSLPSISRSSAGVSLKVAVPLAWPAAMVTSKAVTAA